MVSVGASQSRVGYRHTLAVVSTDNGQGRLALELEYSENDALFDVHWRNIDLASLSAAELSRVHNAGLALRKSRIAAARARGKIGRNHTCPCGSRRKYKHCCGP
jgi:hypothetical protein